MTNICEHCNKKIVKMGSTRANGRNIADWDTRKYHVKCYKEIKQHEDHLAWIKRTLKQ